MRLVVGKKGIGNFTDALVINTARLKVVTTDDIDKFQETMNSIVETINSPFTELLATTLVEHGNIKYLTLNTFMKLENKSSNVGMASSIISVIDSTNIVIVIGLVKPGYLLSELSWRKMSIHPNYSYIIKHLQGYNPNIKQKD